MGSACTSGQQRAGTIILHYSRVVFPEGIHLGWLHAVGDSPGDLAFPRGSEGKEKGMGLAVLTPAA